VGEKYDWISCHLGDEWCHRVIITRDKTLIKGDILIDDKPQVTGLNEKPAWKHVVFSQSYNTNVKGKMRLDSWEMWKETLSKVLDGGSAAEDEEHSS
jgi:5'-nucleotidase